MSDDHPGHHGHGHHNHGHHDSHDNHHSAGAEFEGPPIQGNPPGHFLGPPIQEQAAHKSPLEKAQSYMKSLPSLPGPLDKQPKDNQLPSGPAATDPGIAHHGGSTWDGLRPDDLNPLGGFMGDSHGKG